VKLVLPYPISANRYWRSRAIVRPGWPKGCPLAPEAFTSITYPSKEADRYKRQVKIAAYEQGMRKPFPHRVFVRLELYPHRPLDAAKRMRAAPMNWDDDVMCLNLDNAWKVMIDALNGVAYIDDKWLWKQEGERMEPDAHGERVVVTIEPIVIGSPQASLLPRDSFNFLAEPAGEPF
jgi:crossover junction endodeoxyribonuclease RusA